MKLVSLNIIFISLKTAPRGRGRPPKTRTRFAKRPKPTTLTDGSDSCTCIV